MSDALCGPSNALQNFKSHTSVDRSLQQDRLSSRHQPSQAFRSHDPNAGLLDPEFEAFQSGQPSSAFAGPVFPRHEQLQPFHHPQNLNHAAPSHAGPSQAPAWAADFQNLQIASPPPFQQQKAAWANQFQQSSQNTSVNNGYASGNSGYVTPAMQYNVAPAFGMNRNLMGGYQPQAQLQQPQVMQAQKDDFDEAAFEAAFDAAMEDAVQAQDVETPVQQSAGKGRVDKPDIYPQLPLIRIALLHAILNGSDPFLHEAALFVQQLSRTDISHMDPVQAMLLRPLISRLADSKRSPFAERYQMSGYLNDLGEQLRAVEGNAQITPHNEQLLAAYADVLWARDKSDHLQQHQHSTDSEYWRVSLEENMENWHHLDPTTHALQMLSETNLFGLETPEAMARVLDLEVEAYKDRLSQPRLAGQLPGAQDPQSLLFKMATALRDEPDVQKAMETLRAERSLSGKGRMGQSNMALSDYTEQLRNLENLSRQQLQHDANEEQLHPEQVVDEPQQEEQSARNEDDELAQTAAELLSKVSHEKSSKFQNSTFLGLMRKLADREVRVEGDKMVQTNPSTTLTDTSAPTSWSQSGPMQTPQAQTPQASQLDGQEVVDLLNHYKPAEDEGTSAAPVIPNPIPSTENRYPDYDDLPPEYRSMAYATPSFPSWGWADSI